MKPAPSAKAKTNGGDWRATLLDRLRSTIHAADPAITEERKWAKGASPGIPVWYHNGIVCTGETYKDHVKMTFAKGASIDDPTHLFNSSLDGNVRRAIDLHEGDTINESALKDLIRAAVALNTKQGSPPKTRPSPRANGRRPR